MDRTSILVVNELRSSLDLFFSMFRTAPGEDSKKDINFTNLQLSESEMQVGREDDRIIVIRPIKAAISKVIMQR